jgi:hypothetical protein
MTEDQESSLSRSIRQNMQLKDSDELLAIWKMNDRLEWSDEAFAVVHDILAERLGSVPPQNSHPPRRRRNKEGTKKSKIPLSMVVIFSPAIVVLLLILLIPSVNPGPDDKWFTVLFFVSMALFFFLPGFYFGWKSFFQSKETLKKVAENVPNMKKSAGIFYRFYTYFLPDRFVPVYFLIAMGFMSIMLIYGGIRMVMFLIQVF